MVFDRHDFRDHNLRKINRWLAAIIGFAVVPVINYSFAAGGELTSSLRHHPEVGRAGQFLELIFKTIGVVRDRLQSFSKSVLIDLGKAEKIKPLLVLKLPAVISAGEVFQKIFLFVCGCRTNGYSAGNALTIDKAERHDPSSGQVSRHSEKISWNQNLKPRKNLSVDSPVPSPIKQNRAGHYEEGDCNQRDCRSDPDRDN